MKSKLTYAPNTRGHYSQSWQDLVLEDIFSVIGTRNNPPFCVEFGFNAEAITEGTGSNTAHFLLNKGWKGLLLDGGFSNPAINLHAEFLTSANICDVFAKYQVPDEPEYISIDVDSTDLWLFDALASRYRAMVFSVEYNSHFPLKRAITFPNDPDIKGHDDRAYGASLKSLSMVAEKHGYSLVTVVPKLDAIFVRNDLLTGSASAWIRPLSYWRDCVELIHHKPVVLKDRVSMFIDYAVFQSTGGDLRKSREAARRATSYYLGDSRIRDWVVRLKRRWHGLTRRTS